MTSHERSVAEFVNPITQRKRTIAAAEDALRLIETQSKRKKAGA